MMDRDQLEKPFHTSVIERAQGRGGQKKYVGISHYIRRLNRAFEGRWSFEIVEYQILDSEVLVLGRIKADGVEKTAFGGAILKKRNGSTMSVADDLKAASSDALKKAASLLGMGLDIYSRREPDHDDGWDAPPARRRSTASANQKFPEHVERVMRAAEKIRWSKGHLAKWCREQFDVAFSELTPEQAEAALEKMREIARNARSGHREPRPLKLNMERHGGADMADGAPNANINRLQ